MGSVAELNLVHSPAVITNRAGAPNIIAQLGVDNITAVPEPAGCLFADGAGAVMALSRGRRRRRQRRASAPCVRPA
jgi:hypothetical protein